jgi:eukaryotic-like serine/threonine-protein kinase
MFESSKKWEGQVVDSKFVLGQYLGRSETSAVFLTQRGEANSQKAAIKLISTDSARADSQLSAWRRCAELSHPNLLGLFEFGRWRLENTALLYVVMEFAEENLSEILPQRPLTPAETRDMLAPVLDAMVYLLGKGLVHTSIKPSNILASADKIKLSADTLWPRDEKLATRRESTPYDAPEFASAADSSADEVWSLGVTLAEVLTQKIPSSQQLQKGEFPSGESLPAPFREIVRGALRIDSKQRASLGEIANLLNPGSFKPAPPPPPTPAKATTAKAAPAKAAPAPPPRPAAAVSPLDVPLSPVPPLPRDQMGRQQATSAPAARKRQEPRSGSRFLIPAAVLVTVVIAIFSISKLFHGRNDVPSTTSASIEQPPAKPAAQPSIPLPAATAPVPQPKKAVPQPSPESLKPASEKEPIAKQEQSASEAPAASEQPSNQAAKPSAANGPQGEVLDQVLPEVSEKARGTIHGKVLVTVRAHVDPSGTVSSADLDSPSSSKYFGDLAIKTARRWQFQSPEADGHSLPSEWLLRFEFWPDDTKVTAKQVNP